MINPTIGDLVDFRLVVDGINGDKRTEVKVAGLLNYATARLIDPQIAVKHANLFSYFQDKVNNINDPAAYNYLSYTNSNGTTEVVGIPWILESSYQTVSGRTETFVISNWRESWRPTLTTFLANLGANFTSHGS